MIYLITPAWAQDAATGAETGSMLMPILMMVGLFAIFYFLMIRPQQKRAKEHKNMLAELGKGDEVVTSGGVAGRIVDVNDNFANVEIAENTVVTVQMQAVVTVLPKGTLKAL